MLTPDRSAPPTSKTNFLPTTNIAELPFMYATLQDPQNAVNATFGQYWRFFYGSKVVVGIW
jgi:hypothetical protein